MSIKDWFSKKRKKSTSHKSKRNNSYFDEISVGGSGENIELPELLNHIKKNHQSDFNTLNRLIGGIENPSIQKLLKLLRELIEMTKDNRVEQVSFYFLVKLGKRSLPEFEILLENSKVNIRDAALVHISSIGKPALPILLKAKSREKNRKRAALIDEAISLARVL